jgi:adenosine deaminase
VAAGVTVTVNSDDPPMFFTDLNTEYAIAARLLDLDQDGVAELARAAVRASFATEELKASLTAEIETYAAATSASRR